MILRPWNILRSPEGAGGAAAPAAPGSAAQPAAFPDTGSVAGQAALGKLLGEALTGQGVPDKPAAAPAGTPAPATPLPGAEGDGPANDLTPDNDNPSQTPEEIAAAAQLAQRAQEAGRTAEEQARLESAAAEQGTTVEEVIAAEAAAARPRTYTQKQVEEMIKGRLANLQAKVRELEAAAAAAPPPRTGADLEQISSSPKLDEFEGQQKRALDNVELRLRQLNYNPKAVENYLRAAGAKSPEFAAFFSDEQGGEDYSPEKMGEALEASAAFHRSNLEAVPARRQFLSLQPRGETLARNAHPWLANEEDPKTIAFRELEGTPLGQQAKRLAPFWQYWLGCAVATHVAIVNAVKKNGANGRPALAPDVRAMAGRAPVLPGGAGGGAQPPPKPGPRSALADYHKALKEGVLPATALERFYQATGLGV